MTFQQAAEEILRRTRRPMTTREITEQALKCGLITTRGQTPEATMSAELYRALRHRVIRREFEPGPSRARRGTVRWRIDRGT